MTNRSESLQAYGDMTLRSPDGNGTIQLKKQNPNKQLQGPQLTDNFCDTVIEGWTQVCSDRGRQLATMRMSLKLGVLAHPQLDLHSNETVLTGTPYVTQSGKQGFSPQDIHDTLVAWLGDILAEKPEWLVKQFNIP